MGDILNGPLPLARGWWARQYDGAVFEVWAFGSGGGLYVWVDVATGAIVMNGSGDNPAIGLCNTKAGAIEKVLEAADGELTRARAAVDRLRAELAGAALRD